MHAVILATGPGIHIRPFPTPIPTPLLPVSDTSCLLDVQLRQLAARGFLSVTVLAGRHVPMLQLHLDAVRPAVRQVQVIAADGRLGAFGALVAAVAADPAIVPPTFVAMTASVLADIAFDRLLTAHRAAGALLTLATVEQDHRTPRGRVLVERGRAVGYRPPQVDRLEVDSGVYALSRDLLRRYQTQSAIGFDDVAQELLATGAPPQVFRHSGQWLDLGDPVGYHQALRTSLDAFDDGTEVDLRAPAAPGPSTSGRPAGGAR